MLRRNFPQTEKEAQAYGGWLESENFFFRTFDLNVSYEKTLDEVNKFLFDNGFCKIPLDEFNQEIGYKNDLISLGRHGYQEKLVLFVERPDQNAELHRVIQKLRKFTEDRDWEKFHNSKDLALAISIEASELLELFLWKKEEDFDEEKMKDELADVLSFCFLLADKHGFKISDIVDKKIAKNALKYPVEKAKGNATKYTDL